MVRMRRDVHEGRARGALTWAELARVFVGVSPFASADDPSFTNAERPWTLEWQDAAGVITRDVLFSEFADVLDAGVASMVTFSGATFNGRSWDVEVHLEGPRPWVRAVLTAPPEEVVPDLASTREVFPLPLSDPLVFLSWSGSVSRDVAEQLADVLSKRLRGAEVFFSDRSIDPGDDPMRRMLEDGLLKAEVVVAALTEEAAARPWVIWETAAAWAKGALVLPVFIDVSPAQVPGPLTTKVQGVRLTDAEAMNRALESIGKRLNMKVAELTASEHQALTRAAQR